MNIIEKETSNLKTSLIHSFNDNHELDLTETIFLRALKKYIHLYRLLNLSFYEFGFDKKKPKHVEDLNTFVKCFSNDVNSFLSNKKCREHILHSTNNFRLQEKISDLVNSLIRHEKMYSKNTIQDVVLYITIELNSFLEWFDNYSTQIEIKIESEGIIERLNNEIIESKAILNKINSEKTEEIFSTASRNYIESARIYENLFYIIFIGAVLVTIVSIVHFPYNSKDFVDYILYKVLTVSIIVTIGTIFLRKAAHLRKLHDQANQTSLELQALPLYLRNVHENEHSEIYKKLADKYFGKELDQSQNDKAGELMKDQLAAGTEMIKASAEVIKNANIRNNN